jgi:hypothetical protein
MPSHDRCEGPRLLDESSRRELDRAVYELYSALQVGTDIDAMESLLATRSLQGDQSAGKRSLSVLVKSSDGAEISLSVTRPV